MKEINPNGLYNRNDLAELLKKPVNYEVNAQNQLEKDYENILESGSALKIHISVITNEYKKEDFRQVLKKMAECSHNFYLELGAWLNNKP